MNVSDVGMKHHSKKLAYPIIFLSILGLLTAYWLFYPVRSNSPQAHPPLQRGFADRLTGLSSAQQRVILSQVKATKATWWREDIEWRAVEQSPGQTCRKVQSPR